MTDIHRECCLWWQSKSQFWQHPHFKAMGKFKASTTGRCRDSQDSCKQHLSGTREAGLPERQRLPRAIPSVLLPGHPLPLHSHSVPHLREATLSPYHGAPWSSAEVPFQCFLLSLQCLKSSQVVWQLHSPLFACSPNSWMIQLSFEWPKDFLLSPN